MRSLPASGRLRSVGADGNTDEVSVTRNGRTRAFDRMRKEAFSGVGVESHAEMVMLTLVDAPPAQESLDFGQQI